MSPNRSARPKTRVITSVRVVLRSRVVSVQVVNPVTNPILDEHSQVRALVAATTEALADPPALPAEDPDGAVHVEAWRKNLRERCETLQKSLELHFESEEKSSMYTGGVEYVRFEAQLKELLGQHAEIRAGLGRANQAVATEHPEVAARIVHEVLYVIAEHERAENAILQDALTGDLGVGD